MCLGDQEQKKVINTIPTGCLALDVALGIGGLPRGRMVEVFGPESSGKTTLCQHVIAEAQRVGGVAVFVDVEHALDPAYARKCGVNVDGLYIAQPDCGEQALEIVEVLARSGAVDVIVVDSVAALVPRIELEGEMGEEWRGVHSSLMSQAMRKLHGVISRSDCLLIFTNQLRYQQGVLFGNPETTTGGRALRHYASVRLDMRTMQVIKDGDAITGVRTRVTVKKSKVAAPFKVCEFDIMFDHGISKSGCVFDLAVEVGIVKKSDVYHYDGKFLGRSRQTAKAFLEMRSDLLIEIENEVRIAKGLTPLLLSLLPIQPAETGVELPTAA